MDFTITQDDTQCVACDPNLYNEEEGTHLVCAVCAETMEEILGQIE